MGNIFLVCGLGNIGEKYVKTRHNAGFMFLDYVTSKYGLNFKSLKSSEGEISKCHIYGSDVLFLRPTTFMNNSGKAVSSAMSYYKIPLNGLILVHDDLDIPFGKIKMKLGGGDAGHNGVRSVDAIAGNLYHRVRIGIGRPKSETPTVDYVLGEFSNEEFKELKNVMNQTYEFVSKIIQQVTN